MEMSACVPLPPRSRRSTDGERRSAASRVWTGAAAWAFRSKSGVSASELRVGALWLPEMPTLSILRLRIAAVVSALCAQAASLASKRMDIPTESTPRVTWRRRLAKADQPLRFQRRQRHERTEFRMCSIVCGLSGLNE